MIESVPLQAMREAGRITASVLDAVAKEAKPGITTGELDALALELVRKAGAKPAFLTYRGYPACLCTSINQEVVHGVPSKRRKLAQGDIVGLDFGAIVDGCYGDSAVTVPVGIVSDRVLSLVEATKAALLAGIEQAKPGNRIHDIAKSIQGMATAGGFSVVRDFVGHGIGRRLHEDPSVPNYVPEDGSIVSTTRLKPGMFLAIEPMFTLGRPETFLLPDSWTASTADGSMAAHFEHTIAITEQGPIILTVPEGLV